jgi:hypothetical protein
MFNARYLIVIHSFKISSWNMCMALKTAVKWLQRIYEERRTSLCCLTVSLLPKNHMLFFVSKQCACSRRVHIEGHMNRFEYCHPDNNSDNDSFGSFLLKNRIFCNITRGQAFVVEQIRVVLKMSTLKYDG